VDVRSQQGLCINIGVIFRFGSEGQKTKKLDVGLCELRA